MSTKKNMNMTEKTLAALEGISKKKLTVGNLLWAIREGDEMSLAEFSKILGISRQYLCDIEHGRRTISVKMAAQFAKKLGHSPVQFVRLTIQEEVEKTGLHLDIQVKEAA
jgi:transcriptional regulator with XRE-family HTH domain